MKPSRKYHSIWEVAGFRRSVILALTSALPSSIALGVLLKLGNYDVLEAVTVIILVLVPWLILATSFYFSTLRPWQAVANILMSFRENDFSIKARVGESNDVINIVLKELNTISDYLSSSRSNVFEIQKLLGRILAEVDIAVFLFDNKQKLVMVNRYGASLYTKQASELVGLHVDELNLTFAKMAAHTSTHDYQFPAKKSRWLVKHSAYRQQGLPYQFIMLADIGHNLRQEEMDAWQKLTRILSHEINNALTPLKTTIGSMTRVIDKTDSYPQWKDDFTEGLTIINNRVDNLNRMVNSYSQLARLPKPVKASFNILSLLQRLQVAYKNKHVLVDAQDNIFVNADEPQLEQVLVNLIKNAIEANTKGKPIHLNAYQHNGEVIITVEDSGMGIENIDNLFVPYFTTKPTGSGIGLVVSRQIIEAHGGSLELTNRNDVNGCSASITLSV